MWYIKKKKEREREKERGGKEGTHADKWRRGRACRGMPLPFPPIRGKRRRNKKRQKPHPQALLGTSDKSKPGWLCPWPCPRGRVHELWCDLQARLCGVWLLLPRCTMLPTATSPGSVAKERPQIQGQDEQQPVFPELGAATSFSLQGLACLSPWWPEKGTECMSSKGCSIWNCVTSIHQLPKGSQEFIN